MDVLYQRSRQLYRACASCQVLNAVPMRDVVATGTGMAALGGFFVLALSFTSLPHAFVLSNFASIIIVSGRIALRMPTTFLEILGCMTGITGAIITTLDSNNSSGAPPPMPSMPPQCSQAAQ